MPTIADVAPIAKTLGNILTAEPRSHGALTVIPLLAPLMAEPAWLTLAEAGDRVRVTEVSESGSVPMLRVENLADQALLLLDGEELVGARQNRVLNTTVLVAAGATVTIPVSCVEQGRWHYRERDFKPSDASLLASLRRKKADWVTRSVREGRGHASDQGGLWAGLAAHAADHDVASPTGAMRDFYDRYETDIAGARDALAAVPGQVGAVVYLGGRWVGLDLLAGPRLFAGAWPRLCAGYAGDAIRKKSRNRLDPGAAAVLATLTASAVEPVNAVSAGAEYRLVGKEVAGAALVAEDRVAHLMAFPAPTRR